MEIRIDYLGKGQVYNKVPNEYLPVINVPITYDREARKFVVPSGTYQKILDNPDCLVNVVWANIINNFREGTRFSNLSIREGEDGETYITLLGISRVGLSEDQFGGKYQSIEIKVIQITKDDTVLIENQIIPDMIYA